MPDQSEVTLPRVVLERLLVVADYQRPYAWEGKQLADLWEDLDLLGAGGHHYAGTLVLKRVSGAGRMADDGEVLTTYEVVDGQQRLTTCLLLLDRIRRQLASLSVGAFESLHAGIDRLSATYGVLVVEGVPTPRLQLGADLNNYWVTTILGDEDVAVPELVSGAKRLKNAAVFFDTRIKDLTAGLQADDAARRLRDLQRRVTDGLRFLVYEVHDDAEVGVIFETLNERGRPLTELEKVKNYLLYLARQLPSAQQKDLAVIINTNWSEIFRRLSRLPAAQEERLLRANWLATVNPDARQWQRTASVKRRFPRAKYVPGANRLDGSGGTSDTDSDLNDELYSEVKNYVNRLSACATFLAEMYDPGAEYNAFSNSRGRVRVATAALLRSPVVAAFLPLIFAARLKNPQDGAGYAELVELCEKYSARVFAICGRRSNSGEPYLCRIAHKLFSGGSYEKALSGVAGLLLEYAPDDDVDQNLRSTKHAWYWRQSHKYVLYEYERHLARADEDVIAWDKFTDSGARRTTEHILPQVPDGESDWWSSFTSDDHHALRHSLGNLMLTYDNSYYSNKDYVDKRGNANLPKCYSSPQALRQEQEVARDWETWTPQSISERQDRLAEWALARWAVQAPGNSAVVDAAIEAEAETEEYSADAE